MNSRYVKRSSMSLINRNIHTPDQLRTVMAIIRETKDNNGSRQRNLVYCLWKCSLAMRTP